MRKVRYDFGNSTSCLFIYVVPPPDFHKYSYYRDPVCDAKFVIQIFYAI